MRDGVGVVDLKSDDRVGQGRIKLGTRACAEHDVVVEHGVVDRKDGRQGVDGHGDATYAAAAKAAKAVIPVERDKPDRRDRRTTIRVEDSIAIVHVIEPDSARRPAVGSKVTSRPRW